MGFLGGGFFGSGAKRTSSTTTSNTRQDNFNFGGGDGDIGDVDFANITDANHSTINLTRTDHSAIAKAFDFAEGFASDLTSSTGKTLAASIDSVTESARTESENIIVNLQKAALFGALIWGGVTLVKSFRGGP